MMQKIIISGCNGRMGRVLRALSESEPDLTVVAGVDALGVDNKEFPVFSTHAECTVQADVVIDFSSPAALTPLLQYCLAHKTPVVLATTGYSPEQADEVARAAQFIPVFRSGNMSLGINVLLALVKKAASILGGSYDIEIVERHHNRKVDAPSGTALMLADALAESVSYAPEHVYERQSVRMPRGKQEIGISSVRGGTIAGDHTVIFAGHDEVIELHHHAASREIFARGALEAARFLAAVKTPGLYDMGHLTSL